MKARIFILTILILVVFGLIGTNIIKAIEGPKNYIELCSIECNNVCEPSNNRIPCFNTCVDRCDELAKTCINYKENFANYLEQNLDLLTFQAADLILDFTARKQEIIDSCEKGEYGVLGPEDPPREMCQCGPCAGAETGAACGNGGTCVSDGTCEDGGLKCKCETNSNNGCA